MRKGLVVQPRLIVEPCHETLEQTQISEARGAVGVANVLHLCTYTSTSKENICKKTKRHPQ